jgi:orotate phosphoribosyltransferase-like protein
MTDTMKLEVEIMKSGLTKKEIADELGLTVQGFLLKMQNKTEFKASEIQKLQNILHLENKDIFFADDVE